MGNHRLMVVYNYKSKSENGIKSDRDCGFLVYQAWRIHRYQYFFTLWGVSFKMKNVSDTVHWPFQSFSTPFNKTIHRFGTVLWAWLLDLRLWLDYVIMGVVFVDLQQRRLRVSYMSWSTEQTDRLSESSGHHKSTALGIVLLSEDNKSKADV